MASGILKQQLDDFIRSLQEQHILDISFNELRTLNTAENPRFLINVISTYCRDAEKTITEMTESTHPVDYDKLLAAVHKLKGSSLSIGGKQVAATCSALRHACADRNRERCVSAVQVLIENSIILHERLNIIAQFERAILNERGNI